MAKNSVDILIKARDEASKQFAKIGGSAMSMGSLLRKAALVAGAYFSARAIKNFVEESVEGFARQEMAVVRLSRALDLVNSKYQTREMEEFAASLQSITTYGDEAILELMTLGTSMGQFTGQQLKDATKAAIGLSEAFGIELKAAMTLVAKAAQGNISSLTRYGIKVDETLDSQGKFNEVLKQGIAKFPLAEASVNTLSGAIQQMKNSIGDVKETIGRALAPTIASISKKIKDFAENSKASISQWAQKVVAYGGTVKDVFVAIAEFFINDFKNSMQSSLDVALTVFTGFGKSVVMVFEKVGAKIAFEITKGVVAGSVAAAYFSSKGIIDALIGAAFDGTTFKEHVKNTMDYGKDIADGIFGDMNVDITNSFEEAGKILKDAIKDAAAILPQEFKDKINNAFTELENKLNNISTDPYLTPESKPEVKSFDWQSIYSQIKQSAITASRGIFGTTESRFLQNAPQNNYYSNMIKHNQEIAKNTRELKSLPSSLDNIAKSLEKFANNGGLQGLVEVGI